MGQIGVFMTILEIVSPQNTKPSLFRNRVHDHTGQIFLPGRPKIFLLLSEISPRPISRRRWSHPGRRSPFSKNWRAASLSSQKRQHMTVLKRSSGRFL